MSEISEETFAKKVEDETDKIMTEVFGKSDYGYLSYSRQTSCNKIDSGVSEKPLFFECGDIRYVISDRNKNNDEVMSIVIEVESQGLSLNNLLKYYYLKDKKREEYEKKFKGRVLFLFVRKKLSRNDYNTAEALAKYFFNKLEMDKRDVLEIIPYDYFKIKSLKALEKKNELDDSSRKKLKELEAELDGNLSDSLKAKITAYKELYYEK